MRLVATIAITFGATMLLLIISSMVMGRMLPEPSYLVFWQREDAAIMQRIVDTRVATSATIVQMNLPTVSYSPETCDALIVQQQDAAILVKRVMGRTGAIETTPIETPLSSENIASVELWSPMQLWVGMQTAKRRILLDTQSHAVVLMPNRTDQYAISLDDTTLALWNNDTLSIHQLPKMERLHTVALNTRMLRWSPSGRQIALTGREIMDAERAGVQRLFIYDLLTGERRQMASLSVNSAIAAWSPDGRYVPYSEIEGVNRFMVIVNAGTGNLWRIPKAISGIFTPQWSPDSRWLAFVDKQGFIVLIDVVDQKTYTQRQKALTIIGWVDDNRLVYQSQSDETHIAQWQNNQFTIQTRYLITARTGICQSLAN